MPEHLESRALLAPLVGRDTNDPQMKDGDPANPQWDMEKVAADVAWTLYTGQPKNVVAVMDYGIDYTHEDFGSSLAGVRGQLWDRALFGVDQQILASKRGRDEINNVDGSKPGNEGATKPNAGEYWGNHAAGIIGALTNNSLGVAGMNWSIQLLSSKVLQGPDPYDVPGFNLGVLQRAVDHTRYLRAVTPTNEQLIRAVAFGYSTEPGIDYGDPFPIWAQLGQQGSPGISDPVKGILVTVPAGDFGPDNVWAPLPKYYSRGIWDPNPNPPDSGNFAALGSTYNKTSGGDGYALGSTDNVIVVGATDHSDSRWNKTSNIPRIDIYAPGVSIISVGDVPGVKYATIDGTREAAAHVAGAIGLIYDAATQHGKTVTYHEVRRALIQGGDDIGLDAPRLNLLGALRYLGLDKKPSSPGARTIAISGGSISEGDSGITSATFKLALNNSVTAPLSISVRIDDGTAMSTTGDYVRPANGIMTVVIPAGKKEQTFSVSVYGDRRIEQNETFTATIVNPPAGLTVLAGSATQTILNDDAFPTIQMGPDVRVTEGAGGITVGRIQVFLSKAIPDLVTATYTLTPGTALAGGDFVRPVTPQTVVFRPNTTSQWINVQVIGDGTVEADETFGVTLQSLVNATLGAKTTATVTIVDDDGPVVSVLPAQVRALAGGASVLIFTITLSKPAVSPVSIAYRAIDGTAVSGAPGTGDYLLLAGTLSFAVGERVKTTTVTIQPRRPGEAYPKRFTLELSSPVNAKLSGGASVQTVLGIIS